MEKRFMERGGLERVLAHLDDEARCTGRAAAEIHDGLAARAVEPETSRWWLRAGGRARAAEEAARLVRGAAEEWEWRLDDAQVGELLATLARRHDVLLARAGRSAQEGDAVRAEREHAAATIWHDAHEYASAFVEFGEVAWS